MAEHKQEVPRWVRIFTSHKKTTITAKAEATPAKAEAIEVVAAGVVGAEALVATVPADVAPMGVVLMGAVAAVGNERSEERWPTGSCSYSPSEHPSTATS